MLDGLVRVLHARHVLPQLLQVRGTHGCTDRKKERENVPAEHENDRKLHPHASNITNSDQKKKKLGFEESEVYKLVFYPLLNINTKLNSIKVCYNDVYFQ